MPKAMCVLQISLAEKIYQLILEELNSKFQAKSLLTRAIHIRAIPAKTGKRGAAPINIVQYLGPAGEKRQVIKMMDDLKKLIGLIVTELSSAHRPIKPSRMDAILTSVNFSDIKVDSSDISRGGLITGEHVDWMLPGSRKVPPRFAKSRQ